jgi:hypothetical protein
MNRTFVSYQGHGLKPFLSNGVYMAGDNNLDLGALRDIAEMARVGSPARHRLRLQARQSGI